RQMQVSAEGFIPSFVPPVAGAYNGSGVAAPLINFTSATLFNKLGINSGTSTVAGPDGSGNYYFTADSIYEGYGVVWSILNSDGNPYKSGSGTVTLGVVTVSTDSHDLGNAVVYSATWTRFEPREFRYLYERTCFIPDIDPLTGPVDPPAIDSGGGGGACFGVGQWITHAPSTHYKSADDTGVVADGGE